MNNIIDYELQKWATMKQRQALGGIGYPNIANVAKAIGGKKETEWDHWIWTLTSEDEIDGIINALPREPKDLYLFTYNWYLNSGTHEVKARIIGYSKSTCYRLLDEIHNKIVDGLAQRKSERRA